MRKPWIKKIIDAFQKILKIEAKDDGRYQISMIKIEKGSQQPEAFFIEGNRVIE